MPDPRDAAVTKFKHAAGCAKDLDVVLRYATDPPLVVDGLIGAIAEGLPPGGRVCELGFGSGWLLEAAAARLPAARLVGLDMAAPAAHRVHTMLGERVAIVRGDMDRLPFHAGAVDVAVTCWTLYFMRDIASTLHEIARCVRPGGRVIAATVAPDHMQEYQRLLDGAVRRALAREPEPEIGARFDLASGLPHMRRAFGEVDIREWRGTMPLPDVESALALWRGYGPQLADPAEDAAARAAFARLVQHHIEAEGVLTVTRHSGMFIASP